jgi:hypothetical protein
MKTNMNTVTIDISEVLPTDKGEKYLYGIGSAMCRSIPTAIRIAEDLARKQMAKQSFYGGVPIMFRVVINGVQTRW